MLSLNRTTRVFLKTGVTDCRLGFDGLFAKVKEEMGADPTSGFYFAFCNRGKTRLKVLSFDGSGLTLYIKRLERSTFSWPKDGKSEIDPAEFQALLAGLEVHHRRGWFRLPLPAAQGEVPGGSGAATATAAAACAAISAA